jgi:cytochrome b
VAGVVVTSLLQRENLVASMIHGRKRAAKENDIPS